MMARWSLAVAALCVMLATHAAAKPTDAFYDCQMRKLAIDYTRDVVLRPWSSSTLSEKALSLVSEGLLLAEDCNISSAPPVAPPPLSPAIPSVSLYVATDGNDSASGTEATPLKTISGAQAKIRALYPSVASRPAISVLVQPGDYFFGAAASDHLAKSTSYSGTHVARFTEEDSGSSPTSPITYTAAHPTSAQPARFIGGESLTGLSWAPAGDSFPAGVLKATVPGAIDFDSQDQLSVVDTAGTHFPLVRARTPNGKAWIPMDGFNLTVGGSFSTLEGPSVYQTCTPATPRPAPPPSSLPPRPVAPAPGQCVAAANISLLTGYPDIPGVIIAQCAQCDSPAACMAVCASNPCCNGFTWHDNTTGSFYKECFILTDPVADAWSTAQHQAGHFSGLCNHSNVLPPPKCSSQAPTACVPGTVVCDATGALQVDGFLGVSSAAGRVSV
jgi:hypothetical protein